ncbi:MAG: DUF952 domain-containing protein [Myxococcaceae bacterium]|nr:DUF952 domain-containing protein [Myxococcaceae bacterium]
MSDFLFHLTTQAEWEAARPRGEYRAGSLATEGFIHLSTAAQWRRSAARFFSGQQGLVLLELRPDGLDVRFEPADGEQFPHLYGPLPVSAVRDVFELAVGADGAPVFRSMQPR